MFCLYVKCIRNFAPDGHGTKFSSWRRSEDVVSRVACGVYHFNPCSQTTVKKKENIKNKKIKTFSADSPCPCGARTSPKKLPFRDVHDVGIPT